MKQYLSRLRLRFRTTSLLWLAVVVAAFFIGRQSDEIVVRLAQLWPSSASYVVLPQRDGSLLFLFKPRVTSVTMNGEICRSIVVDTHRARLVALKDGNTQAKFWLMDETTAAVKPVTFELAITNGRITVAHEMIQQNSGRSLEKK
jgi:hypothetical protein